VTLRVMLVEDQSLIRMGIEMALSSQNETEIEIVSKAENGLLAVQSYASERPDVVLMDMVMPVMDGLTATRKIKEIDRNAKIIFLTSNSAIEDILAAFALGANGYCMKDIEPHALVESLKTAYDGGLCVDSRIAASILDYVTARGALPKGEGETTGNGTRLNERDMEVLQLLIDGLASELSSSINTKLTVLNILNKVVVLNDGPEVRKNAGPDSNGLQVDISDKLEFIEMLGAGGMSTVFKARQKHSGRMVAVKIMQSTDSGLWQRFIREARIMSTLSHPSIVAIDELITDGDGTAYIVMELVDGPTLSGILECGGAMIEQEAVPIFLQCAHALVYLHESGVIHRDIKPSNIIVYCENEETIFAKIADFGIAKNNDAVENRLTMAGEIVGSPLYMSPEQCRGEDLDERSDIYSFGCVMFEVLCGFPPFVGSNYFETMTMHVNQPAPLLDEYETPRRKISPKLKQIVAKCLEKLPEDRFQNSRQLLTELEAIRMPAATIDGSQ